MPDDRTEHYLGDGLYARNTGHDICLRAPRDRGDHVVYLDAPMLQGLVDWARKQGIVIT